MLTSKSGLALLTLFAAISVNAASPQWKEITQCSGWDLCLEILGGARDAYEPDSGYGFPYRSDVGVVDVVRNLKVSQNCDGFLKVEGDKGLYCSPNGDQEQRFLVAQALDESSDETSSYYFLRLDFKSVGRARLFKDANVSGLGSYYLEIR